MSDLSKPKQDKLQQLLDIIRRIPVAKDVLCIMDSKRRSLSSTRKGADKQRDTRCEDL